MESMEFSVAATVTMWNTLVSKDGAFKYFQSENPIGDVRFLDCSVASTVEPSNLNVRLVGIYRDNKLTIEIGDLN